MAKTASEPTQRASGETEVKKRGQGPYTLGFTTVEDESAKRCPPNPAAVVVNFKHGGVATLDLNTIDPATLKALAAYGLHRRIDGWLRPIEAPQALEKAVADFQADMAAGKLFVRAEKGEGGSGATRGKKFDFDHWVAVLIEAGRVKKKPQDGDRIRSYLESLTPKERHQKVMKLRTDRIIRVIDLRMMAEKAKNDKTSTYDAFAGDEF